MNKDSQTSVNRRSKGFTLLELIITIVLIGIAGSIIIVGLSSLSGIGQERKTVVDAQLAQERLELILAEKRNNGFPTPDVGAKTGAKGPDPCDLYDDLAVNDYPACDAGIEVDFSRNQTDNPCYRDNTQNCTVFVKVGDGSEFTMLLYNYLDDD